jgi:ATP-dependent RNA circularization protein (DNA/RNA ligase family)
LSDNLSGDFFPEYEKKNYGPEEIFRLIDNQSLTQSVAVKVIENYGLRKVRESIEVRRDNTGIGKIIERLNEQLDEQLDRTIQIEKKPETREGRG